MYLTALPIASLNLHVSERKTFESTVGAVLQYCTVRYHRRMVANGAREVPHPGHLAAVERHGRGRLAAGDDRTGGLGKRPPREVSVRTTGGD